MSFLIVGIIPKQTKGLQNFLFASKSSSLILKSPAKTISLSKISHFERERERETERHRETETDTETDRQRETERQRDRERAFKVSF